MPKSTKRFILSNEALNSNGFYIVTAGINIADFQKNPIMYWMHIYPSESKNTNDNLLPIGYWSDIQINNKELSAVPVFDDSDEFAMKIYNKVEHGTIRAASVAIEPVELDTNKANWKQGQTLPTFLKSRISEASIVDRGSNRSAVTLNFENNVCYQSLKEVVGDEITAPHTVKTLTELEKLAALSFDELYKTGKLAKLKTLSYDTYATKFKERFGYLPKVEDKKQGAPTEKKPGLSKEDSELLGLSGLIELALNTGKISKPESDLMIEQVVLNKQIDAVKNLIKVKPINEANLADKYKHSFYKQYINLSYDGIDRKVGGGTQHLKEAWPEMYQMKFFEKHGRLPVSVIK